jgi:hypothetical protein
MATLSQTLTKPDGSSGLRLNFHAGQLQAWDSVKRIVAVISGNQSGKTTIGAPWLHREMLRRGPGDYLVAGPTFKLMAKKVIPEIRKMFVRLLQAGRLTGGNSPEFIFSPEGEERVFGRCGKDPSRILFGHAADPDSLESATARAAWLDEAGQNKFRLESWQAVQRRLGINQGRVLISTTPYSLGWMKQKIFDPWKASGRNHPEIDVVQFKSIMNPMFPREEYERAKLDLPGWRFRMMYDGEFERPAGMIYHQWEPTTHTVPRFAIPTHWPRYHGLDFGGVNTAGVWLAEELTGGPGSAAKTGRLYAYREYLHGGRTARQHADAFKAGEPGLPAEAYGGSASEQQWRDEFRAAGYPVKEPPIKDVEVGIDRVSGVIQRGELFVFDDLAGLLDELGSYSREVDEAGDPMEKIADKETYHRCFVADTPITTAYGQVPVQDVGLGTPVLTRAGWRPVASCMARESAPLKKLTLSDGRVLVGTADHPIFVEGKGFVPIDSLRYADRIFSCHEEIQPCVGKQSGPSGLCGFATPTLPASRIVGTSGTRACTCIVSSGRRITPSSPTVTTFITKTVTPATTTSATSNCCPAGSTTACTTAASARRPSGRTLIAFADSRKCGTPRKRAANGTGGTPWNVWKTESLPGELASGAARIISSDWVRGQTAFAPTPVRPRREGIRESIASPALVPSAAAHFSSTDTPAPEPVPVHVVRVCDAGRGTVYNLTVAGPHEYFANGILVSNCDALRYIISQVRGGPKKRRAGAIS